MSRIHLLVLLLLASLVEHVLSTDGSIDTPDNNKENQPLWDKAMELAASNWWALAAGVFGFTAPTFLLWKLGFRPDGILKGSFAAIWHSLAATTGIGMWLISLGQSAGAGGIGLKVLTLIAFFFFIVVWYKFGG